MGYGYDPWHEAADKASKINIIQSLCRGLRINFSLFAPEIAFRTLLE